METTTHETWTKEGRSFFLVPVDMAAREAEFLATLSDEDAAMYEPWYPDFPGEREPVAYELHDTATGEVAWERTIRPLDPWSAYDAVSDVLLRAGFVPPPSPDRGVCEHGMAADLCEGPNHYGYDDEDRF